jgi:steroid delta-isomerase-like uncharacterized protein
VSQENVELVRRWYSAWNSGDTDAVIAAFAEDVEWHGHPRLPEPGPYRGRDQVRRWMEQFREAWGELSADPVELLDADESVVALVHMTGRGRGSGVEVRGGVDIHLMTVMGGEVTSFRIVPADLVIDPAGLSPAEVEALVLRVQEGLDPAQIAERLGNDEAETRSTLAGAFDKLRALPGAERLP